MVRLESREPPSGGESCRGSSAAWRKRKLVDSPSPLRPLPTSKRIEEFSSLLWAVFGVLFFSLKDIKITGNFYLFIVILFGARGWAAIPRRSPVRSSEHRHELVQDGCRNSVKMISSVRWPKTGLSGSSYTYINLVKTISYLDIQWMPRGGCSSEASFAEQSTGDHHDFPSGSAGGIAIAIILFECHRSIHQ